MVINYFMKITKVNIKIKLFSNKMFLRWYHKLLYIQHMKVPFMAYTFSGRLLVNAIARFLLLAPCVPFVLLNTLVVWAFGHYQDYVIAVFPHRLPDEPKPQE